MLDENDVLQKLVDAGMLKSFNFSAYDSTVSLTFPNGASISIFASVHDEDYASLSIVET